MKQIIKLTESDIHRMVKEAYTVVQYRLFDEPEVKRIRKTRKDKMTPEQKQAAKEKREAEKRAKREKEIDAAWAKKGYIQTKLDFDFDESDDKKDNLVKESFNHWKSPKLANIVKQHGIGKYNNMPTNYFLTQLTDENIEGVGTRDAENPRAGIHTFQLGDGTCLLFNTKNNPVAQKYCTEWVGTFNREAVNTVRPNNEFALARAENDVPVDTYSRRRFKHTTSRGDDARSLRNNGYFIDGKNKEYNPNSGWNRQRANDVMNNLRTGKDMYGNPNEKK